MEKNDASESGSANQFRLRYGGKYCCVVDCHNSTYRDVPRGIKFHSFPKDTERKQAWIRAINRASSKNSASLWQPKFHDVICSEHFAGGKKENDKSSSSYLPSLFPTHNTSSPSPASVERARRRESRAERGQDVPQPCLELAPSAVQGKNEEENNPSVVEDDYTAVPALISTTTSTPACCSATVTASTIATAISYKLDCCTQTPRWMDTSEDYTMCFSDNVTATEKATQAKLQTKDSSVEEKPEVSLPKPVVRRLKPLNIAMLTGKQYASFCGVELNVQKFLLYKMGEKLKDSNSATRSVKLFLTLAKLKTGLSFNVLGACFNMSESQTSIIFRQTLNALYPVAQKNLIWLPKRIVQARMPKSFKASFSNVRAIIDCSEVECEKPSLARQRVLTYSNYKSRHTVKFLVAVAPSGEFTYVSPTWGGRATDTEITANSKFVELLEDGDVVLADKGFPKIEQDINQAGALMVMPPFKIGSRQFTDRQNHDGYEVASVRVHVERAIQRLKRFHILHFIKMRQLIYIDQILMIIAFLCNLQPDLIRDV